MGYIKGECREQITLFPEILDDYVNDNNHVRFIEAFVNDLKVNDFTYSQTKSTGRPPHSPRGRLSTRDVYPENWTTFLLFKF